MSTDHQTDATGSVSLTVEALELSLLAPRGWTAELIEEGVRLYGPADEQAGGEHGACDQHRCRSRECGHQKPANPLHQPCHFENLPRAVAPARQSANR